MKLTSFRITNFRSIADSGWVRLGVDNVTAIVGQNESGKSSVLDAISKTRSDLILEETDLRFDSPLPEVSLRFECTLEELLPLANEVAAPMKETVKDWLTQNASKMQIDFYWKKDDSAKLSGSYAIDFGDLLPRLATIEDDETPPAKMDGASTADGATDTEAPDAIDSDEEVSKLEAAIYERLPQFVLFTEETGLLPDEIDVTDDHKLTGKGAIGARNFLTVSSIDLRQLVQSGDRDQASILARASEKITTDFRSFWNQTIGKDRRLTLECQIKIRRSGDKIGKPYLVFYISDGSNKLSPVQRSKGLRWFISFYLQLKSSELRTANRYFLLDEPGANLHEKAQQDVLKLINSIASRVAGLMYSTHSPHLMEYEKVHRVLAIERSVESDDSPSKVVEALHLGAANRDTLSPILTKMGADLSRQQVIAKHNNVILEEISCFFYLQAFFKLVGTDRTPHLIAATGVDNVQQLTQMFLGWGLDFVVVLDDEPSGRRVYKSLQHDLFADDPALAAKQLLKLTGCHGIEDIFDRTDFATKVILVDPSEIRVSNADFMKAKSISKPVTAAKFMMAVTQGTVTLASFSDSTKSNIQSLTTDILRLAFPEA